MLNKKNIWLIGPGDIGKDYLKVLQSFDIELSVIGRSAKPNWPIPVYEHGIDEFIKSNNIIPEYAIIATDESELYQIALKLITHKVKNILIEKPAALYYNQIQKLYDLSIKYGCNLFIGYNRRFYRSVQECKKRIENTKDPININFSFTEWSHTTPFENYTKEELNRFFLCNSSHIPDTVFYLAGQPKKINSYTAGKLDWHESACIFQGSGITENDILFSYDANWNSAGRWSIEINLPNEKLILRPIEKLHIQNKGNLDVYKLDLENEQIDTDYKPGLYKEVESFLTSQQNLCTIKEQLDNFKWYYQIANYHE